MSVSFGSWDSIGMPKRLKNPTSGINTNQVSSISNAQLEKNNSTGVSDRAVVLDLSKDSVAPKASAQVIAKAAAVTTQRTLKVGSSGDDVRQLQSNLSKLGYSVGTPDGKYGNGTKNAVISFQKTFGLSADGIAGKMTLDAVATALNRQNNGILAKGQISNNVKTLQENLIKLGFLSGKADGAFGTNTENAVKAFQRKYNLTADGLAGQTTLKKINELIKNLGKPSIPTKPINGVYTPINNGSKLTLPNPGDKITVSLGTDKNDVKAEVKKDNCWTLEYSIAGCRKNYPNQPCLKRLESAISKFSYNEGSQDLLKLQVPGIGECYAGAMVEGFANIGDVVEVTLDNNTRFNFMILDTKSVTHPSSDLIDNNQCQIKGIGHGYMSDNNSKVQLSICEFITSQSLSGKYSAKDYPSGSFLTDRHVTSAQIIGHANI